MCHSLLTKKSRHKKPTETNINPGMKEKQVKEGIEKEEKINTEKK